MSPFGQLCEHMNHATWGLHVRHASAPASIAGNILSQSFWEGQDVSWKAEGWKVKHLSYWLTLNSFSVWHELTYPVRLFCIFLMSEQFLQPQDGPRFVLLYKTYRKNAIIW